MKTKLLLTCIFILLVTNLFSQDFAPSQMAQGYLDSKNATVDYATGLFHYKIPIYSLKSGDYELPISVNYIGKGVKKSDPYGLVGYNWSLNIGGVITRTIRGGIADEENRGYIHQNFNSYPSTTQIEKVNKREIDGESDIFTAIFNGQTVHFIIKKENNKIVAEPLEKTNVKIECKMNESLIYSYPIIDFWIITDENGNKFYFKQKEWSVEIINEDRISFNGLKGLSYISSWHISRIEPRNHAPIVYDYMMDIETCHTRGEDINEVIYSDYYALEYIYGNPIVNYPFNTYSLEAEQCINLAVGCLNNYGLILQYEKTQAYHLYAQLHNWHSDRHIQNVIQKVMIDANSIYEDIQSAIDLNFQIMGLLANFIVVGNSIDYIVSTLDELRGACYSYGAIEAASYLESASWAIKNSFMSSETVNVKQQSGGNALKMRSPILHSIACNNKTILFDYQKSESKSKGYLISKIRIEDSSHNGIMSVQFSRDDNNLKQLSFLDKNGIEFDRINFSYHEGNYYATDIWGFPKKELFVDQFYQNVDNDYCKMKSLSNISIKNNGSMAIDYESHVVPNPYAPTEFRADFGGIRIKSLVLKDVVANTTDSIKYIYPYPGELVYSSFYNVDTVLYTNYSMDRVKSSMAKTKGNAFLNTGNNGIYYNYVEEEFVGKGKKTYLFYTPARAMMSPNLPCRFWLNGLPLGIATYDRNGNLKSIIKNYYYADIDPNDNPKFNTTLLNIYQNGSWFSTNYSSVKYSRKNNQIKTYEYYMDKEQIKSYYQNQNNIFIYRDGNYAFYFNPYAAIYLQNIEPRTNVILPEQHWELIYGGKVLLKSHEEFQIEGIYSTTSSINHFIATNLGTPVNKVEYCYDNIEYSNSPTRINKTDSRGDIHTSVIRRVVDMDNSGVIASMKENNILEPIIKQQYLINNKLLNEVVNIYEYSSYDGKKYFGITEEKMYSSPGIIVSTFPARDNTLFTYGETNYSKEKHAKYLYKDGKYIMTSIEEKGNITTLSHDISLDIPIMIAQNYDNNYISAVNSYIHNNGCFHNIAFNEADAYFINSNSDFILLLYNVINNIKQDDLIPKYRDYMNSENFFLIRRIIELIALKSLDTNYSEFKRYLDLYRTSNNRGLLFEELADFLYDCCFVFGYFYESYSSLSLLLLYDDHFTESYFLCDKCSENNVHINVNAIEGSKLKFYLVSKYLLRPINYTVKHSGGTFTRTINPSLNPFWNIQVFTIDLSDYNGVMSVMVNDLPINDIAYLALVPADCEFEAASYNADGTVFCKFDQTGQMERYEYDGAGRVTKTYDKDGNLLKENTYNFNLPN